MNADDASWKELMSEQLYMCRMSSVCWFFFPSLSEVFFLELVWAHHSKLIRLKSDLHVVVGSWPPAIHVVVCGCGVLCRVSIVHM